MIPIEIQFQIEIMNQREKEDTLLTYTQESQQYRFLAIHSFTQQEKIDFSTILIEVLPVCGSGG